MNTARRPRLTELAATGGCGCKISPARLHDLLQAAKVFGAPPRELIAGAENAEDAAVWKISNDCAMVATADFFAPMVDSPYDFGRIAAANALSDVYAMGARPLFALALAAMPGVLDEKDIADIWRGGMECCRSADVALGGGHSIDAAEPLYGLAVIGRVHPERMLTNGGAHSGDALILGKPLGVGLMSASHRKDELSTADYQTMVGAITTLNRAGEFMPSVSGVHAMTDVTGFGLLGHLLEMCRASSCRAQLQFSALPLFARARRLAEDGVVTGASTRNWNDYGAEVEGVADDWRRTLLTDPQTGGGLLVACAPKAADEVLATFNQNGNPQAEIIGTMTDGAGVVVTD